MSGAGQPQLPGPISPMLATTGELPPDDGAWALEMKWDGVRALGYAQGGELRLLSRSGRSVTASYPELQGMGADLPPAGAVIDGEVVALGQDGAPSFESLQLRMHVTDAAQARRLAAEAPVSYLAFDLLWLEGRPLLGEQYRVRRALLDELALAGPRWQAPPSFTGEPAADILRVSVLQGLEGVVAKRLDSRYVQKRSPSWRKIKNVIRQEVVVGGWRPGKAGRAGQIGSLLVGIGGTDGLGYVGHVGSGLTDHDLALLGGRLAALRRDTQPFAGPVPHEHARDAVWTEPLLVVDVSFSGWTSAGMMRHPVYKGLRSDKDPAQVVRET
jgi:bifunctional non-homologous end joining protein LigD